MRSPARSITPSYRSRSFQFARVYGGVSDGSGLKSPRCGSCSLRRASLLHAHDAGAVPLDLLKEEQDRIARRLAFLDAQIDAGQIEYDQAKANLEDCLALAGDMHAIYMSIDDSLRRICNQAFFERIHVYEIENIDTLTAEPGEPFDSLLDPNLHAAALAYRLVGGPCRDRTDDIHGVNVALYQLS